MGLGRRRATRHPIGQTTGRQKIHESTRRQPGNQPERSDGTAAKTFSVRRSILGDTRHPSRAPTGTAPPLVLLENPDRQSHADHHKRDKRDKHVSNHVVAFPPAIPVRRCSLNPHRPTAPRPRIRSNTDRGCGISLGESPRTYRAQSGAAGTRAGVDLDGLRAAREDGAQQSADGKRARARPRDCSASDEPGDVGGEGAARRPAQPITGCGCEAWPGADRSDDY